MKTLARTTFALLLVAMGCGSASCKSDGGGASTKSLAVVAELGRGDVGPAGGTVTGGPVTITVPAGALGDTRTIIISKVDATAAQIPHDADIVNDVYQLEPDDVTFAKPVTVSIAIDAARKRTDGRGAVVLFRASTGTQEWTPYGANDMSATALVGTTTHFSDWMPTQAAETGCFLNLCAPIPPPRDPNQPPPQPTPFTNTALGLDCMVPSATATAGVHCVGTGPNKSSPYQCSCIGKDQVLGQWHLLPPDTAITALAAQCGGQCPATCDPELVCDASTGTSGGSGGGGGTPQPGYHCRTALAPTVTCTSTDGVTGTCSCDGKSMPVNGPNPPLGDALFPFWKSCGGDCAATNGGDWVCPGLIGYTPDSGVGCTDETAGTCRDDHYYGYTCDVMPTPGAPPTTCHCSMDGKPTKDVQSNCFDAFTACGFPKVQGAP